MPAPYGYFYDLVNTIWRSTKGQANDVKHIHVYPNSTLGWKRAVNFHVYQASSTTWQGCYLNFPPAIPTASPNSVYLSDLSFCNAPDPRYETWRYQTTYTMPAVYVGIYRIQAQFVRDGVGQGWVNLSQGVVAGDGTAPFVAAVIGSWVSDAPQGQLGEGGDYASVLWAVEARYQDLETSGVGPSNGTGGTNAIGPLALPYCNA